MGKPNIGPLVRARQNPARRKLAVSPVTAAPAGAQLPVGSNGGYDAPDGKGIRGLALDAELFAIKVLPGGRVSHLIDALNRCIELQVHLLCLAVGCEG